jgi:hypothetical protein
VERLRLLHPPEALLGLLQLLEAFPVQLTERKAAGISACPRFAARKRRFVDLDELVESPPPANSFSKASYVVRRPGRPPAPAGSIPALGPDRPSAQPRDRRQARPRSCRPGSKPLAIRRAKGARPDPAIDPPFATGVRERSRTVDSADRAAGYGGTGPRPLR